MLHFSKSCFVFYIIQGRFTANRQIFGIIAAHGTYFIASEQHTAGYINISIKLSFHNLHELFFLFNSNKNLINSIYILFITKTFYSFTVFY